MPEHIEQATAAPGEKREARPCSSLRERAQWAVDNERDYWAGQYLELLDRLTRG